jgi:hypothetical protein
MLKKGFFIGLIFTLSILELEADVLDKKGKWYGYWGYNLSQYSNSDISFKGDTYNYTLYDVSASDRQTKFSATYITEITIPQFNLRFGYFIDDRQSISFGTDHMKYVVDTPQTVTITGTDHQGTLHNNGEIPLDNFLAFEHTDGLNYFSLAYNYFYPLWEDGSKQHAFSVFVGAGAGILVPRSNITLIGYEEREDEFKLAGYGVDVQTGFHLDMYESFFLRGEVKGGYMSMPSISTTDNSSDSASQSFNFIAYSFSLGYTF